MTRYTSHCCRCGADGHISDACTQPVGAEYVPEVATTEDAGETWFYTSPFPMLPCTPALPQSS